MTSPAPLGSTLDLIGNTPLVLLKGPTTVVAAPGCSDTRRNPLSSFTGRVIDAHEARHIGLLHLAVPASDLDAAVDRTLHFWAKGGPIAQREAKALALRMAGLTRETAEKTDAENAALIARLRVSPEGQQGLTAFLEKSRPPWTL